MNIKRFFAIAALAAVAFTGNYAFAQDVERHGEMRQKFRDASPEERQQMLEKLKSENPERYERIMNIREQVKDLPPEERRAKLREMREEFKERREERRGKFEEKWNSAPPEKRIQVCDKLQERCDSGVKRACFIVENKCGN